MAGNPPASPLLRTDEAFWSATPRKVLQMTVEFYNESLKPDEQLNWENIKRIFSTTTSHSESKTQWIQRDRDMTAISDLVQKYQDWKDPAETSMEGLLKRLDHMGIIYCPNRKKWGIDKEFLEDTKRPKDLPAWR